MASKPTIKRIVLTILWALVTGGVVTLLIAANGKQQQARCADVRITVRGTGERYYISKSDITFLLSANGEPSLKGLNIETIDLARLERRLRGQSWIKDAELYFDRGNVLHVTVTERQPIARVFATNGSSFYIDSSGARMPLLPNISARVPVITNYPSATRPLAKDSAVLKQVRQLVQFISGNDFWNAQLAQIDITPAGGFELLPTVGNHIIRLGNADSLEKKLGRLLLFYKQVLSQCGFDKYSVLDVQYAGQVVAVHKGEQSAVDSAQLKRNISELLRADQIMAAHTAAEAVADKEAPATDQVTKPVSVAANATAEPVPAEERPEEKPKLETATPVTVTEKPKPVVMAKGVTAVKKQEEAKKTTARIDVTEKEERKPKAVMKKKDQ